MAKHISNDFYPFCHVMSSDEDQPIVMDINAGINLRGEIAVSVDLYDYDEPCYNCSTAAIIRADDGRRMAARHKIEYERMPRFISDCMEEWREIINPDFRQVLACFKEITDCIIDEGCRMRIQRTYGRNGHMCC